MNGKIDESKLITIFEKSNLSFLKNDSGLLSSNVSERSWYSRFSIYLTEQVKKSKLNGYYVDTEYNRNGNKLKTIFDNNTLEIFNITCDLIIHSRGEIYSNDNLICIEMKKSNSPESKKEEDKKRLRLLTKKSFNDVWSADGKALPEHVCGYKLGIYYEVDIKNKFIYIEYYVDGKLLYDKFVVFEK